MSANIPIVTAEKVKAVYFGSDVASAWREITLLSTFTQVFSN